MSALIATPRFALPLSLAIALSAVGCQADGNRAPAAAAPASTAATPPTSPVPAKQARGFHWQCNDVGVSAIHIGDGASVALIFSGRDLYLPLVASASGARYADDAGNEFWTKGDSGTLTLAAEDGRETARRECTRSERPSPWFQAAERGVGFRAVGNEPGWFVEVDRGMTPALHATLDYGERKIEVSGTEASANGYSGATADGARVVLSLTRQPCQDDMSGEWFEAGARLEVGDRTYHGCGAFLFE